MPSPERAGVSRECGARPSGYEFRYAHLYGSPPPPPRPPLLPPANTIFFLIFFIRAPAPGAAIPPRGFFATHFRI